MARGFDEHQARVEALTSLGRSLARRSGSCCELCRQSGVRLAPREVEPLPEEPDLDRALFLCETCTNGLGKRPPEDPRHWHCLQESIWSDVPAVQVMAVRKLREIAEDPDAFWARECLETLYLEPEIEEWVDAAP